MAVAASVTTRVRIGSGVTDVQRTHPAVIAQQYLTLHHISAGRCILGIGAGEGENTVPYGISTPRPVSMLEDALEMIHLLWSSEGPVAFDSSHWTMRGAVLGLGPVAECSFPAIWVAGHGPRMLDITGRLGDGWIPMLMSPEDYAQRLGVILKAKSQAQRPGTFEPAIWSYVCYGESREDCLKVFDSPMYKSLALLLPEHEFEALGVRHPLGPGGGLQGFIPSWFTESELIEVLDRVPVELVAKTVLHGSVEDIVSDLEALRRAGVQTAVLANVSFLTDENRVRNSYAAQRQVLERFRA
jgi:phthiodiolone/phenolphthiodiolone dimycocerosates ketoreductase